MAYVPTLTEGRWLDLPLNLPQTEIDGGRNVIVGCVQLPANYALDLRYLSLHFIGLGSTDEAYSRAVSGLPLLHVGLYGPDPVYKDEYPGDALFLVGTNVPECVSMPLWEYVRVETPGTYTLALFNNSVETPVLASVSACLKLTRC